MSTGGVAVHLGHGLYSVLRGGHAYYWYCRQCRDAGSTCEGTGHAVQCGYCRWRAVRDGLELSWRAKHATWPEPVPEVLAEGMCRYTAEYVQLVDPSWRVVLGVVDDRTHCWNETATGRFLDLTGDQFGFPPVQLFERRPGRYRPLVWTVSPPDKFRAQARRWLEVPW